MIKTNEWNRLSEIREAIGETVVFIFPNASTSEAVVYEDEKGDVRYHFPNDENYPQPPVFWKFK